MNSIQFLLLTPHRIRKQSQLQCQTNLEGCAEEGKKECPNHRHLDVHDGCSNRARSTESCQSIYQNFRPEQSMIRGLPKHWSECKAKTQDLEAAGLEKQPEVRISKRAGLCWRMFPCQAKGDNASNSGEKCDRYHGTISLDLVLSVFVDGYY